MKPKSPLSTLAVAGLLLGLAGAARADFGYTLQPLALPNGSTFVDAGGMALNDQGMALAWGWNSNVNALQAFVYSSPTQLQVLPYPAGAVGNIVGNGLNNLGQVVGTSSDGARSHATLWSAPNAPGVWLGGNGSTAVGINDDGLVAGNITTADGRTRAAIFTAGGPIDIGGPSQAISTVWAVANGGYVVGFIESGTGFQAAWFDYAHGSVVTLGGLGGMTSAAEAVNDHGLAAGFAELASGNYQAALFDFAAGSVQGLGTLGGDTSYAFGINNLGQVVGMAETATGADHYFVWDAQHGMQDLQSLIDPSGGWQIQGVSDINNLGQVLVKACLDGQCQAALLNPLSAVPEPSTWALMAAGLGWMVSRRRRC